MDDYMMSPFDPTFDFAERVERMYPDSYNRIYPQVQNAVDALDDGRMYDLTSDDVDRLTEETMARSGVMSDPPEGHSRSTISDLARALVVRELSDRRRRRGFFPFPFFFFPFDRRDRDRRHDRWY